MSQKKIFVGNLSWKATEDQLRALFEPYGEVVSVKIIVDQYTGKSKGFGFVEFKNSDDAQRALNELNEKLFLDRNLRLSFAQERGRSERGSGGGGRDQEGGRGWGASRTNSHQGSYSQY